MMKYIIFVIFLMLSCKSIDTVEVYQSDPDAEIIVFPSWKTDTVDIYIPKKLIVENKSFNSVKFDRFDFKPAGENVETDIMVVENQSIEKLNLSYEKLIEGKSVQEYTFYLRKFESKDNVDKKFWQSFPADRDNFRAILTYEYNKVKVGTATYAKLSRKILTDSISLSFESNNYYYVKVGRLGENKFKTINLLDAYKDTRQREQSIFKP